MFTYTISVLYISKSSNDKVRFGNIIANILITSHFKWLQLRNLLYECDWIEWDQRNQKALQLTLIYLSKPLPLMIVFNKQLDIYLTLNVRIFRHIKLRLDPVNCLSKLFSNMVINTFNRLLTTFCYITKFRVVLSVLPYLTKIKGNV